MQALSLEKRTEWIDVLKAFLIFCVILGHLFIIYAPNGTNPYENPVCKCIYMFHMPFFMVISGYFSKKLIEGFPYLKKRFLQLIIPTISFYITFWACGLNGFNLWFLPSLFVCNLLIYLYYIFEKKLHMRGFRTLILCFLFLIGIPLFNKVPFISQYKIGFMLPFFCFGLWFDMKKLYNSKMTLILGVITAIMFLFWKSDYIWYFSKENWLNYSSLFRGECFFDYRNFFNCSIRLLCGIISSSFFISLFWYIGNTIQLHNCSVIGRYTLQIYLIQTLVVEANFLNFHLSSGYQWWFNYLAAPILSLFLLSVCLFIVSVIQRTKWLNILYFGNYRKYYQ